MILVLMLVSFALTLVLEFFIAFLLGVRKKGFLIVFLVNLLTNPFVVYTYHVVNIFFLLKNPLLFQVLLEVLVVFVEGFVYNLFGKDDSYHLHHPVLLSIVSNVVSWGTGLIINLLL